MFPWSPLKACCSACEIRRLEARDRWGQGSHQLRTWSAWESRRRLTVDRPQVQVDTLPPLVPFLLVQDFRKDHEAGHCLVGAQCEAAPGATQAVVVNAHMPSQMSFELKSRTVAKQQQQKQSVWTDEAQ